MRVLIGFVLFLVAIQAETIGAVKVPGDLRSVGANSKAWLSTRYFVVELYPQTTVSFNDEEANELNTGVNGKKAKVKALYNDRHIAYLIEWSDTTNSIQDENSTNSFADGFAIQIPAQIEDVLRLPYIGMGNSGREVLIYLKKEIRHMQNEQAYVSEGFGSLTKIKENINYYMDLSYKDGKYKGVLVRPIKDEYTNIGNDATIVAFALWDGELRNRDGLKLISSWIPVKMNQKGVVFDTIMADAKNGEKLTKDNCASCHRYGVVTIAPKFMAPDLSNIGGYSTSEYLFESIVDPNAVIVPGYNKNAHRSFEWYTLDSNGVKTSTMPSFEWMDENSKKDIVAYLKSLKSKLDFEGFRD